MYAKSAPIKQVNIEPENVPKHIQTVKKNGIIYEWKESLFYSPTKHEWLACQGKRKHVADNSKEVSTNVAKKSRSQVKIL